MIAKLVDNKSVAGCERSCCMLTGSLFQLDSSDVNMKELEKNLTFVQNGGWYKPANCTCHRNKKVFARRQISLS